MYGGGLSGAARAALVALAFAGGASGCAHAAATPTNITDYVAMGHLAGAQHSSPGSVLSLYRDVLAKAMWSQCRWLPSDSNYLAQAQRRCGPVVSAFLVAGRVLAEPSVSALTLPTLLFEGRQRWIEMPPQCL